jgi:adenine phosphoribosyltransferase
MFRDVTTLLGDAAGFKMAIHQMTAPFASARVQGVAGIEARGFILGGAIADKLGCGFVPVRKKGKLPWKTIGQEYTLEYGVDIIEMHQDAIKPGERILIVDDLIATGGTAEAAVKLVRRSGGEVVGAVFIIDLPELGGLRKLAGVGVRCHTLMAFEGH